MVRTTEHKFLIKSHQRITLLQYYIYILQKHLILISNNYIGIAFMNNSLTVKNDTYYTQSFPSSTLQKIKF
jgi:hypothetical protein